MGCIHIAFPCVTKSEMNQREHWAKRYSRMKKQKELTRAYLLPHRNVLNPEAKKYYVTMTRVSCRRLDDDNLASAFKAIRDEVADFIGIDDGSDCYIWNYEQVKVPKAKQSVEILIEFTL